MVEGLDGDTHIDHPAEVYVFVYRSRRFITLPAVLPAEGGQAGVRPFE